MYYLSEQHQTITTISNGQNCKCGECRPIDTKINEKNRIRQTNVRREIADGTSTSFSSVSVFA